MTQPRPMVLNVEEPVRLMERMALLAVERAARRYAEFTHGNLNGAKYREREEARDALRDALSGLDVVRGK